MFSPGFLKAHLALILLCAPAFGQTPVRKETASPTFPKEGAVIEQMTTRVVFQSDGTYTYDQHVGVRVQSDAGVRQYGVLSFPYQASVGRVEVQSVREIFGNGVRWVVQPKTHRWSSENRSGKCCPHFPDG